MKTEILDTKQKNEESLAKIAITKEADRALVEMVGRIEDGFYSGRSTKQDVASQIIMRFVSNCTEQDIHAIRASFFDPILAMEAKLKKAKETGIVPDAIRILMLEEFIASSPQHNAKKTKKTLNHDIIIDNVLIDKGAA